jgi:uncharacterized protein YjbI with pentapeptide repeats
MVSAIHRVSFRKDEGSLCISNVCGLCTKLVMAALQRIRRERMKTHTFAGLAATFALLPALIATPAVAESPEQVQQLLETRMCAGCDLSGANLSGEHLIGVDLRWADLSGANLVGTNLEGADLTGANLEGANLTDAFLTNATLNNANLNGIDLTRARMYHAQVSGASMQDITLTDAEVYGTGISIGGN